MNHLVTVLVLLWSLGSLPGVVVANVQVEQKSWVGQTLVVIAPKTQVKVGTEVVAEVGVGERFGVVAVNGEWLFVRVTRGGQNVAGWIKRDRVRIVDPILQLIEEGKASTALSLAAGQYAAIEAKQDESAKLAVDFEAVDALNRVGLARLASGDAFEAIADFREVLESRIKRDGEMHEAVAEAYNNLGVSQFRVGKYAQARSALERAVEINSEVLGDDQVQTLHATINLWQFEREVDGNEPDWELFSNAEQAMLAKAAAGELGGSLTAADLRPMRSARILHPTLKLSFSAPGYQDGDPQLASPVAPTAEAAWWLRHLARLVGSSEFYEKAVATSTLAFGETHFQAALALANQAATPKFPFGAPNLISPDVAEEQLETLERAIAIFAKLELENPLFLNVARRNLGICLLADAERRPDAMRLLKSSLDSFRQHSKVSPQTGLSHEIFGLAAFICQDFSTAVEHLAKAHEIQQRTFGIDHQVTTATLNSLGIAYFELGDIHRARSVVEQALRLRQGTEKESAVSDSLRSMNDLGVILTAQGDLVGARELFEHVIAWLNDTEATVTDPWLIQQVEMNLWVLRVQMGDYAPAQNYFQRILESDDTFAHLSALSNLATVARLQGNLAEARDYLESAIQSFPEELQLANDLGAVLREQGDWQRAEEVLTRVIEQRSSSPFPDADALAFSQTSLALVEQRSGKYAAASARLSKVLVHCQKEFGPQCPRTIEVLRMLGQTELLAGNGKSAQKYLRAAFANRLRMAEELLPSLSEAEALAHVVTFHERDAILEALDTKSLTNEAYEVVWKTRALATRVLAPRRSKLSSDPEVRSLQSRLREIRTRLSTLLLDKEQLTGDSWEVEGVELIQSLSDEKEALERQLASVTTEDLKPSVLPGIECSASNLLAALPDDLAVVDFLRVHKIAEKRGWHYEAFVLRPRAGKESIQRIHLGPADAIDAAVSKFRSELVSGRSSTRANASSDENSTQHRGGDQLRSLVWAPLEPYLAGLSTVIVVPDGALTAIPWGALPAKDATRYLIEDLAIATVAYPHQILGLLTTAKPKTASTLLAGGIKYSQKPASSENVAYKSALTRGAQWATLPATEREVRTIAAIAPDTPVVLRGTEASETRLKAEMPHSRFVHLATHGFFADPKLRSATHPVSETDFLLSEVQATGRAMHAPRLNSLDGILGRNPMVLSGVVLAGASVESPRNEFGAPLGEDGILTAEEVSSLDLKSTELVVLSACETGLGTVAGGEGVFGLQRAFAYAGARTTISSLWKVDDTATATLMEEFYRNLWGEKLPKLEALRQAQIWMLRERPDSKSARTRGIRIIRNQEVAAGSSVAPYYWASFVLSGDWQ